MRGICLALIGCALVGTSARACEVGPTPYEWVLAPIEQHDDGSFLVRDKNRPGYVVNGDAYSPKLISGEKVIDVGGGHVAQKLSFPDECGGIEKLLYTDCNTGAAIKVDGITNPDLGPIVNDWQLISYIQYPNGPIALRAVTSVADVEAVAKAHSFDYTLDVMAAVNRLVPYQRYDPFIGCKIFYPDSAGAKM